MDYYNYYYELEINIIIIMILIITIKTWQLSKKQRYYEPSALSLQANKKMLSNTAVVVRATR